MSKHTPGPWYRIPGGDEWSRGSIGTKEPKPETMDGDNWWTVASCNGLREEAEANANLIAAAPELLEALLRLRAAFVVVAGANSPFSKAALELPDAAIIKAGGNL